MTDLGIQLSLSTRIAAAHSLISHPCQPHLTLPLGMVLDVL